MILASDVLILTSAHVVASIDEAQVRLDDGRRFRARVIGVDRRTEFIQTVVAINPGGSGSPLFNSRGEVIAINSMIYSGSGGYMGLSFSMPINFAMKMAAQLRMHGTVPRAHLPTACRTGMQRLRTWREHRAGSGPRRGRSRAPI